MELVLADGGRVRVHTWGTGPPVVLLHGVPDTGRSWALLASRLAQRYRCIAPDLPGFGGSDRPAWFGASLDDMARWCDEVIEAVVPDTPVDLVLHDFGGPFGLAWAVRHPARVRRIVVMNTVFFPEFRWHFWARVWRTPVLGELSLSLLSRQGLLAEMRRGSPHVPTAFIHQVYDGITPEMKRAILQLYRASHPRNFAPWQEGYRQLVARVPLLVIWGDRDPYIASTFADRFGAPDVQHVPDGGHWLFAEAPDDVATRLAAFLAV